MKFSPYIEPVPFPPISAVKEWIAGRSFPPERPLIDLCQAVPDYAPAPELIDHLRPLLDDPQTSRYSPDEGLPEVRAAVAAWLARRYGSRSRRRRGLPDHRRQPGLLAGPADPVPGRRRGDRAAAGLFRPPDGPRRAWGSPRSTPPSTQGAAASPTRR